MSLTVEKMPRYNYIVKILKLRFDFEWYASLNSEKQCYMVPSWAEGVLFRKYFILYYP